MISQPVTNDTIIVVPPNGNFSQTEKPKPTHQRQDILKKCLKDEVNVIGTIQIFCGMVVLNLGIILASASFSPHFTHVFSTLLKSGYPFAGPLCFVISGSLSIITEKKSTKPLVHSSLAGSILSIVTALVGFILLSVHLSALSAALLQCELDTKNKPTANYRYHFYQDLYSIKDCFMAQTSLVGTLSLMLICTVLELCLAVFTAVLWWKKAHSDFRGTVRFLSQSCKDISNTKMPCDRAYEELLHP
ncbi:membrane-spanning 4-domains subfamily A member 6A-like [Nycticebus coucang]|uniref:membrane-spanning 4-domains subfamily A member 6A-like n=1 Tax=Nycticebus coucang TaxID=9470 RepID=UPI00234C80A6|nr:membrane-spanning 4-domains subfamily A member 6A-like [Nycticebus coucang]